MQNSKNWKMWKAFVDLKTCIPCRRMNGMIYSIDEIVIPPPPLHNHCRCEIDLMKALIAGSATNDGINGADWYIKKYNKLPSYYITKSDAKALGWQAGKGNLGNILPGKMIFGGEYRNRDGKLPSAPGRIWYEADINYRTGRRNTDRLLFSNDGLIFVTYDHYTTFYELI